MLAYIACVVDMCSYIVVYLCVLCIDDSNEGRINDKNQCRRGIFVVCRRRRVSSS